MEVIEPGAGIVIVTPVTDRIDRADGGGEGTFCREVIAPSVIVVLYNGCFGGVDDLHYVALQVFDIVVIRPVVGKADILARRIADKCQRVSAPRLADELISGVDEGRRDPVIRPAQPPPVHVIGEGMGYPRFWNKTLTSRS